ncbi:MAG: CPBP family intramembrane metalloprotease [Candidatus Hydrogenedentes bacterium]|nr:CPBP family intramembrane metalloprotease [Candidatus Hydrogenedentota bacterium]
MTAVFLSLLGVHTIYALLTNRAETPPKKRKTISIEVVIQLPLFIFACHYGWEAGVISRQLVSPVYIGLGLLAGHLVFGVSLLITHRSLHDTWSHFFDFGPLWKYASDSPLVLSRFFSVAVVEELIWRVAAQPLATNLLGNAYLGVTVTAVLFSIVHRHFFRNTLSVSLEFLAFALLLGGLYQWTGSLILVIVIHAIRDIEIAYLEYLIKAEELGDEALAAQHVEQTLLRGHPENP